MKAIFVLIILLMSTVTHSQSGFFGKNKAIDFSLNLAPSTRTIATVNTPANNMQSRKLRYLYPNFQVGYLHQIFRRMDIGLSYEYARLTSVSDIAWYNGENDEKTRILSDINFKKHLFGFRLNFYQNERISPIGKYIGFSLKYGLSILDEGQHITHGALDSIVSNSSFFNKRTLISSQSISSIDYINNKISYFLIRATVGRKYPINNRLSLNLSVSYPVVSLYSKFQKGEVNPLAFVAHIFGAEYPLKEEILIKDGNIKELMRYTNFFYNGIQLKIGLNYYF